jgi:SAM-dependent methyltransferase
MKSSLELNKVVLLGRTFEEYIRYFGLSAEQLRGKKILDIASGVGSFCAEANAQGLNVTAFDPIYELSAEQIQKRCEPDLDFVAGEIGKVKAYKWDFYKSPEGMRQYRERAYKLFIADFGKLKGTRYLAGTLPRTPFPDGQFDLTLVSYLLFVYEDQFDYEFHRQSLREIMRITSGEARIYPLVNFKAERCGFVDRIKEDPSFADFHFEEVKTDFEFLANSNAFLKITRRR